MVRDIEIIKLAALNPKHSIKMSLKNPELKWIEGWDDKNLYHK